MKHIVKHLLSHEVQIDLIGVGGTGSLVLSGLVRLNHAIADGYLVARVYKLLEEEIRNLCER